MRKRKRYCNSVKPRGTPPPCFAAVKQVLKENGWLRETVKPDIAMIAAFAEFRIVRYLLANGLSQEVQSAALAAQHIHAHNIVLRRSQRPVGREPSKKTAPLDRDLGELSSSWREGA